MPHLHAILLQEGRRLFALLTTMLAGQAYALRAYVRELKAFETDVRTWLYHEAMVRVMRAPPIAPKPTPRAAPKSAPQAKRTAPPPSRTPHFALGGTGKMKLLAKASAAAPDRAPLYVMDTHTKLGRRLEAVKLTVEDPERALARLVRHFARAADAPQTARVILTGMVRRCDAIIERLAPHLAKFSAGPAAQSKINLPRPES